MKKLIFFKQIIIIVLLITSSSFLFSQNTDQKNQTKAKRKGVFEKVDKMPEFPGGSEALMKFINSNIKYPKEAKEKNITGTVKVNFIVNKDGTVSDAKPSTNIGGGCEEEAVRVIKMMPKWVPGQQKGVNVPVYFTLPVKFALK